MRKGTLENGFEFEINEEALDDMELLDAMAEAESGDPLQMSRVMLKVLGKPQRDSLYEHLRNESGRVPIEAAMNALVEIMNSAGEEGKN